MNKKQNNRVHYETTVIPVISRKAYFRNNLMIENVNFSAKKEITKSIVGRKELIESETDIDIYKYNSKQCNILMKHLENMHEDIGVYGLISRHFLEHDVNWQMLDSVHQHIKDILGVNIKRREFCCLCLHKNIISKAHGDFICLGSDDNKIDSINSFESLKNNKYDTILLLNYLHHQNDIGTTLSNLTLNLKKNGRIIISEIDMSDNSYKHMFDILHEYQNKYILKSSKTVYNYSIDDIKQILQNNKLKIIEEDYLDKTYYISAEL